MQKKAINSLFAAADADEIRMIAKSLLPQSPDTPAVLNLLGLKIQLVDDAGTELTASQALNDMESLAAKKEREGFVKKPIGVTELLDAFAKALGGAAAQKAKEYAEPKIKEISLDDLFNGLFSQPKTEPMPDREDDQEFPIPVFVFADHAQCAVNGTLAAMAGQALNGLLATHDQSSGLHSSDNEIVRQGIEHALVTVQHVEKAYTERMSLIENECARQIVAAKKRDEGTPWVTLESYVSESTSDTIEIRDSAGNRVTYVTDATAAYTYAQDNHLVVIDRNTASVLRGQGTELI